MTSDPVPEIPRLRGPVPLAHLLLRNHLREGDLAVGATAHDTLLLAELVGNTGRVWAFDIQEQAILQTAARLTEAGLAERVKLLHRGHETMAEHVRSELGAVTFNLGYLPGGDQSVVTRPETTLAAFGQALGLLRPGGILAVSVYPGHDGGASERRTVDAWAAGLPPQAFHAWRMGQLNVPASAPYCVLIQRAT
jgi:hypothetical protein